MNQAQLSKYKRQSRITINTSNKKSIHPLLNTIVKEKLLSEHLCSMHHCNFNKFCITCKKDICFQCESESHEKHKSINYKDFLPDLNEISIIQKELKEYKKNYFEFLNIINNWKKEFDNILSEYQKQMNSIFEYINGYNNEKNNLNNLYKYRRMIFFIFDSNKDIDNNKNKKILNLIEKIIQEKDNNKDIDNYKYKIRKDFSCFLSHNQLKEIINTLNNETFFNKITKIINIIDYKNKNENKDDQFLNSKTPNLNFYKNINLSSYTKHNTSASTFTKHNYKINSKDNNKTINQNSKENSLFKLDQYEYRNNRENKNNYSKSTNDININNELSIYERKKIREKSNDYKKSIFLNFENLSDNNKINKINLQETINKIKIKSKENIYDNYINNNCCQKIIKRKKRNNFISNKAQNLINKSLLYDYKGFDVNDKDSGPELLNNSSFTIKGVKYCSNSIRSNSLVLRPFTKYKYFRNFERIYTNGNSTSNSLDDMKNESLNIENNSLYYGLNNNMKSLKKRNYRTIFYDHLSSYNKNYMSRNSERNNNKKIFYNSLTNFFKPKANNSVLNINKPYINNNSFKNNTPNIINMEKSNTIQDKLISNQIYNNCHKNKKIYVHKKYAALENISNLSIINNINKNILSIKGENNNKNNNINNNIKETVSNINNKYINKNKTNEIHINGDKPLFIGLELGISECKIGVINKKNEFEIFNYNNQTNIPIIISFIENKLNNNNDIKIGEEAEALRVSNASQTIFNIIKIIGKRTNEIVGRKDLWPFIIYNDEKTNIPYIKIKSNNKTQYINYDFEELLTIFLKKLFEIFFNKIKIDKSNEKGQKINSNNLININIVISIPNYYTYLQRKIVENIFRTKLFPQIEIYYKNQILIKSNICGKYNIQLNNIQIENASNLAYFCINENEKLNNNIKNSNLNYLILLVDEGSINISIIRISKKHNNYIIEVKGINGDEFGEDDFVDNFICFCLSDFKEKIRKNCLSSPVALAKLRKSINIVKKCFNKEDILQTEVSINKIYDTIDLKISINKNDYIKTCLGLFRKIINLIKETISKSNIEIKNINDIILIGNIAQNIQLKNMISDLFKDNNKRIYNKLINKNENDKEIYNYIIKGAVMQSFNISTIIPKFKIINITHSSFGIESINGLMDIVIEKGSNIPIKFNKYIRIKKPDNNENNMININIYEGENKYVKNNRLISSTFIDIKYFKYEKKDDNNIEILFQFFIDSKSNLSVYILDKFNFRKKYECLINTDVLKNK